MRLSLYLAASISALTALQYQVQAVKIESEMPSEDEPFTDQVLVQNDLDKAQVLAQVESKTKGSCKTKAAKSSTTKKVVKEMKKENKLQKAENARASIEQAKIHNTAMQQVNEMNRVAAVQQAAIVKANCEQRQYDMQVAQRIAEMNRKRQELQQRQMAILQKGT